MSKIKDRFKPKWNGIIKIKCVRGTPPEIAGRDAEMTIDLASDKEITVSTNKQSNWPDNIYGKSDKQQVKMDPYQNCTIQSYKSGIKIIPDTGVTYFITKLKNNSSSGDPDATVTVGEEPPTNGKG